MLEIRGFSELQLIDQLRECVDVSESIDSVNENYYVRLRIESNGNSQLYVDASDGSIVYNVRRIS